MGYIGMDVIDLSATLMESGQCFRWKRTPLGFAAVLGGEAIFMRPDSPVSDPVLRKYLDLDRDYGALARRWADDPVLSRAAALFPGLRVLNQPAWDAAVQFIISANNNVPRITRLVHALSERYGKRVETEIGPLFALPEPERLAGLEEGELRALGMGYRAPYLIGTARRVCEGFPLDGLRALPYEEARRQLLTLPGVGDKVADCILLFGCGHAEAFPVDVWVERLLGEWFGLRAANRVALKRLAMEAFGDCGGIAQQFLFHAARTGLMETAKGPEHKRS